ncbi:MAG: hypothetical protein PHG08_01030 [Bacilli bacterium]|nr:hypothetical protein [Bacilli bacterium]
MLSFKYIRPNKAHYGHTKVFNDGEYIGYFMPLYKKVKSSNLLENQNWEFIPIIQNPGTQIKYLFTYTRTRKELLEKLELNINKKR